MAGSCGGRSRRRRPLQRQVVIALIVTTDGLPLAYEVFPGNTVDKTTLKPFLEKIEKLYGKARRVWVMDRGIPTEATLEEMRNEGVAYLVGTPREAFRSLAAIQLVDMHISTTDGRKLVMPRYTEPETHQEMILDKLALKLPKQPPPRIRSGEVIMPTDPPT